MPQQKDNCKENQDDKNLKVSTSNRDLKIEINGVEVDRDTIQRTLGLHELPKADSLGQKIYNSVPPMSFNIMSTPCDYELIEKLRVYNHAALSNTSDDTLWDNIKYLLTDLIDWFKEKWQNLRR